VVVELTLLACVGVTWRWRRPDPDRFAVLAAMWLAFTPYYLELFMGQFSMVQAALIFGMLLLGGAADRRGPRLFGALWVGSVLWKINTVILAPALAWMGRWRTLAAGAALAAATTLPYFLIFPAHAGDLWANNFGNTMVRPELGNLGFRQLVFAALDAAGAGPGAQAWTQLAVVLAVGGTALALTAGWRAVEGRRQRMPAGQGINGYGAREAEPGEGAAREGAGQAGAGMRRGEPGAQGGSMRQAVTGEASAPRPPLCWFVPGRMLRPYGTRGAGLPEREAAGTRDLLSLWLAAYFLAAPQVWEHHYVMLLPAIVAAYGERPSRVLAGLWLLLALPTPFGFTGLEPMIAGNHDLRAFAVEPAWMGLAHHAAKALPAVGLFGYWAWRVTRDKGRRAGALDKG
jgi:hypothetical protein